MDYKAYPVLFVDDEPDWVLTFENNFKNDFTVLGADSPRHGLEILRRTPVAVVVSDEKMPEMRGVDFLREARLLRPEIVPVILSGYADFEALIRSLNSAGLFRFIPKPFDRAEMRKCLCEAIERYFAAAQNADNAKELARLKSRPPSGFDTIIGRSPAIQKVIESARRFARSANATVLIEGPTGTGKELLARAIHDAGPRGAKPFIAVNMGAMTHDLLESRLFGHRKGAFTGATADHSGYFEEADGGTLFLDEIGDAGEATQRHLLRALQDGEIQPVGAARPSKVDVRIIAATNRNLEADVDAARFRADLLHRIKVLHLRLPALHERGEDIDQLAQYLLAREQKESGLDCQGLTIESLSVLRSHPFPGNVRQLRNQIVRALFECDGGWITPAHLFDGATFGNDADENGLPADKAWANQEGSAKDGLLKNQRASFERDRVTNALNTHGSVKRAAEELGITVQGLYKKMNSLGVASPSERNPRVVPKS